MDIEHLKRIVKEWVNKPQVYGDMLRGAEDVIVLISNHTTSAKEHQEWLEVLASFNAARKERQKAECR